VAATISARTPTDATRPDSTAAATPDSLASPSRTRNAPKQSAAARRLAAAELEDARAWGAPRPIGLALRTQRLIEGGDTGIELLREAVAELERSPSPVEQARALIDPGAALHRSGRRREARESLRRGADLARRCEAHALTSRALEKLRAAGARPRRLELSGVEALTPGA
jgi:hypothetical protein